MADDVTPQTGALDADALQYLTPEEQEKYKAEVAQPGLASRVLSDVGGGVLEAPQAVTKGVVDAVGSSAGAITTVTGLAGDAAGAIGGNMARQAVASDPLIATAAFGAKQIGSAADWLSGKIGDPDTITGSAIKSISQFVTGMIGLGKVAGPIKAVTTVGKVGAGIARGAVVDATAFEGLDGRLSDFVEQYPTLSNPISRYLATDGDDTEAVGRLKNAMEGAVIGPFADAILYAVRARKLFAKGKTEDAKELLDKAGEAVDKVIKEGEQLELDLNGGGAKTPDAPQANGELPGRVPGETPKAPEVKPAEPPPAKLFSVDEKRADEFRGNLQRVFNTGGQDMARIGADFNFDNFKADEDILAAVNAASKFFDKEIGQAVGGNADRVRTHERVRENAKRFSDNIADIVGADPNNMVSVMKDAWKDLSHVDSKMLAYRELLLSLTDRVQGMARVLNDGALGPSRYGNTAAEIQARFVREVQILGNVQAMFKGMQTNLARGLNAMKIKAEVDPDLLVGMDAGNLLAGGAPEMQKLIKRMAMASGPKQTVRVLQQGFWGKTVDSVKEYWINSILSGPTTQMVNAGGTMAHSLWMPAEKMVAGAISLDKSLFKEGARQYMGMALHLKDSFEVAGKAFRSGEEVLDPTVTTVENATHAISASNYGIAPTGSLRDAWADTARSNLDKMFFTGQWSAANMVDALGILVRLPTRMSMTTDELFKQLNYRSYVYAQAMEAADSGVANGTLTRGDIKSFLDRRMETAFSPEGIARNKDALEYAREATFTRELYKGSISRDFQNFAARHPMMSFVVPFIRTPTNLFRFVGQHTPGINMLSKRWMDDFNAGGTRRAEAMAKVTVGTGLWLYAGHLAASGMITGGGPTDPDAKREWIASGMLPYSFKSVDPETGKITWRQFSRMDPFATFFGTAADAVQVWDTLTQEGRESVATAMTAALARQLESKTYIRGIIDVATALGNPDRYGERAAYRFAGSFIPSALAHDARVDDGYMHEVRSMIDALKARTPGWSKEVDPVRNALGDKVTLPTGWGWEYASPMMQSSKNDRVAGEIARLMMQENSSIQRPEVKKGNVDLFEMKVGKTHQNQSAWDRWQELQGSLKIGGKNLRERVEELLDSDAYKTQMTDGTPQHPGSRLAAIRKIVHGHRQAAYGMLLQENPNIAAAVQADRLRGGQVMLPE